MGAISVCVFIWLVTNSESLSLPVKDTSGCFGTGSSDSDFLKPKCPIGDIILVENLYVGSKNRSLDCPSESTDLNRNHARCCTPSVDDCLVVFDGGSKGFYSSCIGRNKCMLRVDRVTTRRPCRLHKSTLTETTILGSTVFLHSDNYPDVAEPGINSTCRVSVPCGIQVKVTVLDLQLADDRNGSCAQFIELDDGASTQTLDCVSNNDVQVISVYTSQDNFVLLNFANILTAQSGQFLIQLDSSDSSTDVLVTCGTSSASAAHPEHVCTTLIYHTEYPGVNKSFLAAEETTSRLQDAAMHPGTIAAAVVASVCLLAIIFLVVVCYLKKKKQKEAERRSGGSVSFQNGDARRPASVGLLCFRAETDDTWATPTQQPPGYTKKDPHVDLDNLPYPVRKTHLPPLTGTPGSSKSRGTNNKISPRTTPTVNQLPPMATRGPKLPSAVPQTKPLWR